MIEVIATFIEWCELVVVDVVFWLTATMLATMLGAYVSCTGRKHGFVYWVLRVCVLYVLLRYDYVFQWHRCRYIWKFMFYYQRYVYET